MTKTHRVQQLECREELGALLRGDLVKINLEGYNGLAIYRGINEQKQLIFERKGVGGFGVYQRFYRENIRRLDVEDNKIVTIRRR